MSAPVTTPTIPTSIQIATPFSYAISNADVFPGGYNYYEPTYTLVGSQPTTFSNSAYTPDTYTTVTTTISLNIYPNFDNFTYYNFYGPYYIPYFTPETFQFQLPWQPDPTSNGTFTNSRVGVYVGGYYVDIYFTNIDIDATTRYVTVYATQFYYDGDINYYLPDGYVLVGNFAYTKANRTITFTSSTIFTQQIAYSFDFFGGAGGTTMYSSGGVVYTYYFFAFKPLIYQDITGYNPLSSISVSSGQRYTYNGISYIILVSVTNQIFREYGPLGRYNYSRWLPVELTPPEYNFAYNYFVGDRVVYNQIIYKALINHSGLIPPVYPSYWEVSDINYPQWSSSVNYSQGDRVYYNGLAYQATGSGSNFTPTTSNYVIWSPIDNPDNTVTFTATSPPSMIAYSPTFPTLSLSNTTSSQILPFITGNNSLAITFSSAGGFQSIPSNPLQLVVNQVILDVVKRTTTYPITILPVTITTTPTLTSPLSLITYQPFAYTYSIPDTLVNVGLRYNSNTTSTALVPYIANGDSIYEMLFRSTLGLTSPGTTRIVIEAILNGNVIATSDTSILTIAVGIIITPSIPTGSLSFYKYEPFSYVFTINSSLTEAFFQVNRSSSELQTFLAVGEDLQSVTFAGSFLISYSTPLNLVVDLVVGTTIISTQTILVSVGPGRFFPPAPNQNFQLYQYENVSNTFGSNIEFLTVAPMTTILSTPSLPIGLTFGGSGNTFFIQGTPSLQVGQSNYQIIGSNSSNGRIVTSTISLRVNPQQIRITPSTSTLTGLMVDSEIAPIVTTAIRPATNLSNTFRYTWTSLPDGLNFQNNLGSNVSQPFQPLDDPLTITLVGAPSLSFARFLSTSGGNLFQTRLTATQTNQTGAQTIGTSLFNFSLGETVLVDVSNSVTLYKDKPLGTTDVLITAGSFFSSAIIQSVDTGSLPPGLSLVQYISPTVYRLTGTPTTVNLSGSYTFTATNTNGNTGSIVASIPINPDVVTFGGSTPANGTVLSYILSKTVTPIVFSATSTSTTTPPTYTASIPLETYGLTLDSATGILSGTPTTLLSSTTITITATNIFGTTGTTTIVVTIIPDVFTWPTYTPTYFQNKDITPFEFNVSTLSGRPILSYSSTDLPLGLVINLDGLLLGAPTVGSSGSFTIIASTGYTILSQVYTYTLIADQLMILQDNGIDNVLKIFGPNFGPNSHSENLIIAGGGTQVPTIAISFNDGVSWTPAASSPLTVVQGIAWNGLYWVAVGSSTLNTIATSPDGINWTGRGKTVFTSIGNGVAWNGSYWVAVGSGTNSIATSTDGINWIPRSSDLTSSAVGIAWNESYWVAVGFGLTKITTSTDGINWIPISSDFQNIVNGIAWNGSYWIAVGGYGLTTIATSTDGINWIPRSCPFINDVHKVAWNGSYWIAVGVDVNGDGKMASSTDGIIWTEISLQILFRIYDITWNGSLWAAVGLGSNNIMITSPDGINWTSRTIPVRNSFTVANRGSILPSQGVQYRAIQYSSDSFVNAVFSIGALSPVTSSTISVTSDGLLSGNFITAILNTTYSATLTATYETITTNTPIYIVFTSLSDPGTVRIPTELTTLTFSQPTQTTLVLYEYVPYSIPIQAVGSGSFIYYYSSLLPNGFQLVKNATGTTATLSGISPTLSDQGIIIYAKINGGTQASIFIKLRTITPFFVNPQSGAGAYTAILKNDVLGNAAQNARDNRTFPEVNPLAGPLMAPRAPDVTTPDNCILNLCKKPCPTCHTMM